MTKQNREQSSFIGIGPMTCVEHNELTNRMEARLEKAAPWVIVLAIIGAVLITSHSPKQDTTCTKIENPTTIKI